jgi:PAS domain-containing protein
MPGRQGVFGEVALALDIGHWLVDLQKMLIYWPVGLGVKSRKRAYNWTSFDTVVNQYVDNERMRFMSFIEDLVRNPGDDRVLSITAKGPDKQNIPLRLSARYMKVDGQAYIYGVIVATGHSLELEDQAHSLSLVLDAVFYAAESGMVVLDDMLRITRANREAIAVLGVKNVDAPQMAIFAEMESRIPTDIREQLMMALRQRATTSGIYRRPLGRELYHWRATPWGKGVMGARGVALVFTKKPVEQVAQSENDVARLKVLENVHIPVVVLKPSTAEIRFANQAARTTFHMKADGKHFVKNLVDLCGRAVPAEAYEEVRKGGQFINLKMGARLTKVDSTGEELLVEYGLL